MRWLPAVMSAVLLSGCAAQKYPIDATLACDCAPSDARVHQIMALAEQSGYVRHPEWEQVCITDAENRLLLDFEERLARQQPGMWTEWRRNFGVPNVVTVGTRPL